MVTSQVEVASLAHKELENKAIPVRAFDPIEDSVVRIVGGVVYHLPVVVADTRHEHRPVGWPALYERVTPLLRDAQASLLLL